MKYVFKCIFFYKTGKKNIVNFKEKEKSFFIFNIKKKRQYHKSWNKIKLFAQLHFSHFIIQ